MKVLPIQTNLLDKRKSSARWSGNKLGKVSNIGDMHDVLVIGFIAGYALVAFGHLFSPEKNVLHECSDILALRMECLSLSGSRNRTEKSFSFLFPF